MINSPKIRVFINQDARAHKKSTNILFILIKPDNVKRNYNKIKKNPVFRSLNVRYKRIKIISIPGFLFRRNGKLGQGIL